VVVVVLELGAVELLVLGVVAAPLEELVIVALVLPLLPRLVL
jgi:hypothetical protein